MGRLPRWAALAAFCTAFGFVGSAGGLWLMNDELRGPAGPTGSSVEGPAGPAGESAEVPLDFEEALVTLVAGQRDLADRVDAIEGDSWRNSSGSSDCFPTPVVTSVTWNSYSEFDPLEVGSRIVCLPVG